MKELIRFQTDRGLDKKEFIAINENANIFEELLESVGLGVPKEARPDLKAELSKFISHLVEEDIAEAPKAEYIITTEDRVDAFCDVITFSTGALLKLGYDPEKAIAECGKEINSRVGSMVDGKFEKDLSDEAKANWYKADYSKAKLS